MATREELLALLSSRRRGLSIRPTAIGPPPTWQQWLEDDSRLKAAAGPERAALVEAMAQKPLHALPLADAPQGRWARFRGLFRQGWGREREEGRKLRYGASVTSVLFNFFFAAMLLWLTYLQFLAFQSPAEETVRIRITGFGTPDETGGGEAAAEGDASPTSASAAPAQGATVAAAATSTPTSATASASASAETQTEVQASATEAAVEQPLQVTESSAEPEGFQLPPAREVAVRMRDVPVLQTPAVPSESDIPEALPEVRSVQVPVRSQTVRVPELTVPTRELPTAPEAAPQVRIREMTVQPPGAQVRVAETSTRPLPAVPAQTQASGAQTPATSGESGRITTTSKPGLPGATGQSPKPGQQAAARGVGAAARTADSGWPSPRRDDDWGAADRNRAGAASGGDRGNPRGQGGSGLFDAEGRPRLADDSFKPRFPDPYKDGSWLKRPSLNYRGTMFDGIWRPPETLLQEWVRKGIKAFDIPLPGSKVKIRCVVSILQAGGGCGLAPGENGVHDQPARARPAPNVPFKPELFENQSDLTTPKPAEPAPSKSDDSSPVP